VTGRRVKLMADYRAFPLWAVPDDAPGPADDLWCGELAPDALPLSASLVADLRGWADRHDRLLAPGFAWPSEHAKAAFADEGRRLLARVRNELGPAYDVVYFDETTGRLTNE